MAYINYTTAIFLVSDKVRAIKAAYDIDKEGKPVPSSIRTYKTVSPDLKVGDIIVVPTEAKLGFSINKVIEVDIDVEPNGPEQMTWVVDTVDLAAYEAIKKMEDDAVARMKAAERRRASEEMKRKLLEDNPELQELGAIAGEFKALGAPPVPPNDGPEPDLEHPRTFD